MKTKTLLLLFFSTAAITLCASGSEREKELKAKLSTQHVEIEALVEKLTDVAEQIVQAEKQKKQLWQSADPETRQLNDQAQTQFDAAQENIRNLTAQSHKLSRQLSEASKKADMLVQRLIKGIMQQRMVPKQ